MSKKLGIAVVGCGYWGGNYVRIFNELSTSKTVVACDQRPEQLEKIQHRFPGIDTTTNLDDVLHRKDVHGIVICTQAATHHALTRACLVAGKDVLVEKPLTTESVDAEDLISLAEVRKRILMVGHTFVYNSAVWKLRELITQEKLGEVYYMYAQRTNLGPVRGDVSALWDLASHDISIFNFLLGKSPELVSTVGVRVLKNCRHDVGFISLEYASGVVANIHVSWADAGKVRRLVIVGSQGRAVFDDMEAVERIRFFEKGISSVESEQAESFGEHNLMIRDGDIISPRFEVSEPLKNQCVHFLECVADRKQPKTGGREGLEVVRVLEAAERSIEANGSPVKISERYENGWNYYRNDFAVR